MISISKSIGFAMLLGAVALAGMPDPADATQLRGTTIAPNWALGSPQPVFISGCSDRDAAPAVACFGHFGLGPLSDVLDIALLGRSRYTEASLNDAGPRRFVFGLLETGNEQNFDWWNLWIPNARWVGLGANQGIGYCLHDPIDGAPAVLCPVGFGDAIAYVNIGNAAHILWASNNSDDLTATLPLDFLAELAADNVTLTNANTNPDGSFDTSQVPLPNGGARDCTTDPACTPSAGFDPAPSVPAPSSLILIATALASLAVAGRRKPGRRP